ncbi:MAG: hypothetical protein KBG10_06510 [Anaerolineaceae bacterium]|nr:hypothetical protein [Anaerolineaceae bacterium]
MSDQSKRLFLGFLLIAAGVIFLLQQLFHLPFGNLFIASLFALGGFVFLYFLIKDRSKWWAAIPGFTLIGLGLLIAFSALFPKLPGKIGGAIFLASIGVSFLVIYLLNPARWWPIIPAGVILTIALVAALPQGSDLGGATFFLGVGATFGLLGLHPMGKQEKWPWIPAAICLGLGLLILILSGALIGTFAGWIWAALFILAGIFLIFRAIRRKG